MKKPLAKKLLAWLVLFVAFAAVLTMLGMVAVESGESFWTGVGLGMGLVLGCGIISVSIGWAVAVLFVDE